MNKLNKVPVEIHGPLPYQDDQGWQHNLWTVNVAGQWFQYRTKRHTSKIG